MELAVATDSVPPAWWDDEHMVATVLDVIELADAQAKSRR